MFTVTASGICREQPNLARRDAGQQAAQVFRQIRPNGLIPWSGLGVRDVDHPPLKIDVLQADGKNLHAAHPGVSVRA